MKFNTLKIYAASCYKLASILMLLALSNTASGAVTPPDLTVCDGKTCENTLDGPICSQGFEITFKGMVAGNTSNSGKTSYNYEICDKSAVGSACECSETSTNGCTKFHGLSHFDLLFPNLGTASCMSENIEITGTCSYGNFVLGDGSCFEPGGDSKNFVAKCDNTNLPAGGCLLMTVSFAGETVGLGTGPTIVVDKEAQSCSTSCITGPSCDNCNPVPDDKPCLTRTIGFWGTHPWITNDYAPVEVCGVLLGCNGDSDGKSNPSCGFGQCTDIMEGLGSIGKELKGNAAYVSMVKQLTAAKLNLNATSKLFSGASCSDFKFGEKSISEWISSCENLCGADQAAITGSGCIEALDAFNNSQDIGFTQTPAPFDRPSIDDFGNVSGADSKGFTGAQKTGVVVGKSVNGKNCVPPVAP